MTIKKIALSMGVSALLTTSVFAANITAEANVTQGTQTYNTVYTGNLNGDINATQVQVKYKSGVDLLTKNVVTIKLDDGAKFLGAPGDWTLGAATDGNSSATGVAFEDNNSTIKIRMDADVAKGTTFFLNSSLGDDHNTTFALNSAATTAITAHITAKDNENDIVLDDAAASFTLFSPKTYKLTGVFDCGKDVYINSDGKTKFAVGGTSGATDATHAKCNFGIAKQTNYANIDFDYRDVNVSYTMTAGNFVDGNFTTSTTSSSASTTANPAPVNNVQSWTQTDDVNRTDFNTTLTYKLVPNNILSSEEFPFVAKVSFNKNNNAEYSLITKNDDKKMVWQLSNYVAKILNMRSNVNNMTNTYIKLYNNDTVADAKVDVQVTPADGSAKVNLIAITTVPKNGGSTTLTAQTIADAYKAQIGTPLANGYTATISYEDTDKTDGNAIATQTDAGSSSAFNMRVEQNRKPVDGFIQGL